jgi:hypothetical protein
MASDVDICNMALSHVGDDGTISSIEPPDGSVQSGHCARFYPIALAELLDNTNSWGFARTTVRLAPVTNTKAQFGYAYALPSDCIRPLSIVGFGSGEVEGEYPYAFRANWYPNGSFGKASFYTENGVLYTDKDDAELTYGRYLRDTSRFNGSFVAALSYLVASYLAGPLIKGSAGASASSQFRQAVFGADGRSGLAGKAGMLDANAQSEQTEFLPAGLLARS